MGSDPVPCQNIRIKVYFNSRSRVGSDLVLIMMIFTILSFQFTLPCGERLLLPVSYNAPLTISIHAPVWGATSHWSERNCRTRYFNSRSRVGSDFISQSSEHKRSEFQFTLPCGERQYHKNMVTGQNKFQFTLPCGERQSGELSIPFCTGFQFTLPCGERREYLIKDCEHSLISIHAPVWGATQGINALTPF